MKRRRLTDVELSILLGEADAHYWGVHRGSTLGILCWRLIDAEIMSWPEAYKYDSWSRNADQLLRAAEKVWVSA